jgi:serine protease Do
MTQTPETTSGSALATTRRRAALWLGASSIAIALAVAAVAPVAAPAAQNATAVTQGQTFASFADVVEKARPAVVSVRVKAAVRNVASDEFGIEPGHPLERFFRQFEGRLGQQGEGRGEGHKPMVRSQGSGFFVSDDGYLVTNHHVIDKGSAFEIVMDDGRTLPARLVGADPKTDLAVLKVDEKNLPFVRFAGGAPRVGDWVVAVGNPFGLGGTVTAGIVSARGRDLGAGPYDDFLQIDAAVNSGNSGGPSFNLAGEVVGVNTAIASPSGGNVGIAFAVPAETAAKIVAELKDKGSVQRGFIGVQIQPVTPDIAEALGLKEAEGALVADVVRDGPAAQARLRQGDVIVSVNGERIRDPRDLTRRIGAIAPGEKVEIVLRRGKDERTVSLTVARQTAA